MVANELDIDGVAVEDSEVAKIDTAESINNTQVVGKNEASAIQENVIIRAKRTTDSPSSGSA